MRYFTPTQTLVYYDGPQLLVGRDNYSVKYLALALPPTRKVAAPFLAVGVSDTRLDDYLSESVDLRSIFRRPKSDRYFSFSIENHAIDRYVLKETAKVDDGMLPSAGFFASQHTEKPTGTCVAGVTSVEIPIDGRWDMHDLAKFPNKFTDTYAFLFAVNHGDDADAEILGELFQRYPWRGGYSAVSFYNDLYRAIPKPQRLRVDEIQYASPGHITLQASAALSEQIQELVVNATNRWREIAEAAKVLHAGLQEFGFLGVSNYEVEIDATAKAFLQRSSKALASEMRFHGGAQIHRLGGKNWVATAKILLSFYRRLVDLAEFYDSGKVSITNGKAR